MPAKLSASEHLPVPVELVERRIYLIRSQKVMLDSDLADLYQVLTKNLNLAVRRNTTRFPPDFMFQLTKEEAESLRLQIATSNPSPRRSPVRMQELEATQREHSSLIVAVVKEIRKLKHGPRRKKPRIGFYTGEK